MSNYSDITNKRFGKLTAIKRTGTTSYGKAIWLCKCDCGNYKEIDGSSLRKGNTKSCGCLVAENHPRKIITNISSTKKLYKLYSAIKQRCYNKKCTNYKNYGGRGIIMSDEWLNNSQLFYNWAIESGYKEGLTIDRIDVNGNYEPSNCRWLTIQEQQQNRTNTVYVIINNKRQSLNELCKKNNVSYNLAYQRLRKGKPIQELFKK